MHQYGPRKRKGPQMPSRTPVEWAGEHQKTLDLLIDMLVNPPVLAYPDFNLPFVLHTDASEKGLGAILYQHQDGGLRVIAYGSRTLSPAEKNYRLHIGKLEFLALKCARNLGTICFTPLTLQFTLIYLNLRYEHCKTECSRPSLGGRTVRFSL